MLYEHPVIHHFMHLNLIICPGDCLVYDSASVTSAALQQEVTGLCSE